MMNHRRRRFLYLFWSIVGLILLLGFRRIIADPNGYSKLSSSPVVINELVAANGTGLTDEDSEYADWIELYNRSSRPVNLANWTLTDTPDQPNRWLFPDVTLDAGEYLVVFASGKDRRTPASSTDEEQSDTPLLHTNFKLISNGGFLALYPPTARLYLDGTAFYYTPQFTDMSFGRYGPSSADAYGYFSEPTPGRPNPDTATWQGMLSPVAFSVAHGLYNEPFSLKLTTSTSGAVIRYTTDFSLPTLDHGAIYVDPIAITQTTVIRAAALRGDYLLAPVVTQSYIFPADVTQQSATPPGFPATWGTHEISFGGYEAGAPVVADYAMDPEIVNDSEYGPLLVAGLTAIPSLSLVTEMANLDIYANARGRGAEWERPVSVEFMPAKGDAGDTAGFQVNAGVRIQGGAGRWQFMPKHSFRLFFKSKYGPGQLASPIFPDSPASQFDTLVLRAGVDRSFAGHPPAPERVMDHRLTTYTRDEWARASQIAMSGVGSHGIFVHLYLNGLYWGLYNVVERPDTSFMTTYFDGTRADWYSANHGGSVEGRTDRFDVLLRLAREGGLADPAQYATMLEFIDPEQFSDYVILNWYAGNRDWPENNWYVNVRFPAGRNYFFVWDAEDTWNDGAEVRLGSDGFEGAPFPNVTKLLFLALIENPDFRLTFADRLYKHLFHGGVLTDKQAQERWLAICNEIETAIVAESARWGDVRYEAPVTLTDWRRARDVVVAQMNGNGERLLALVREQGYYPQIDPPQFSFVSSSPPEEMAAGADTPFQPQSWSFHDHVALAMNTPTGVIYFTTDGSDPREAGTGAIAAAAVRYVEPLMITSATVIQARVWVETRTEWSALAAIRLQRAEQQADVRITEIMYNPLGGDGYEFVELANLGSAAMDLSGAYFEGIQLRFPRKTVIAPGQRMVLIGDFRQFRERYPVIDFHGLYEGSLSNRGETITLRDAQGTVITSVTYADGGGWPLSPDGAGDSLVWTGRGRDLSAPQFWQASAQIDGSPGAAEP